mmetsp:Transcript_41117/g.66663  ORF Transcript_41117/g.66663 Transcript_41117/m.66663 type:complete len:152 (+) Transcript_41117:401-856(+)
MRRGIGMNVVPYRTVPYTLVVIVVVSDMKATHVVSQDRPTYILQQSSISAYQVWMESRVVVPQPKKGRLSTTLHCKPTFPLLRTKPGSTCRMLWNCWLSLPLNLEEIVSFRSISYKHAWRKSYHTTSHIGTERQAPHGTAPHHMAHCIHCC